MVSKLGSWTLAFPWCSPSYSTPASQFCLKPFYIFSFGIGFTAKTCWEIAALSDCHLHPLSMLSSLGSSNCTCNFIDTLSRDEHVSFLPGSACLPPYQSGDFLLSLLLAEYSSLSQLRCSGIPGLPQATPVSTSPVGSWAPAESNSFYAAASQ